MLWEKNRVPLSLRAPYLVCRKRENIYIYKLNIYKLACALTAFQRKGRKRVDIEHKSVRQVAPWVTRDSGLTEK